MKKFKEKIYDGLPSQKKKKNKRNSRIFSSEFSKKIEYSYHALVQMNCVKNGSIVHFEQNL